MESQSGMGLIGWEAIIFEAAFTVISFVPDVIFIFNP